MVGTVTETVVNDAIDQLTRRFFEITGYGQWDVLAVNTGTRKFVTRNGGVYQMSESGKVLHIAGPSPDPTERL